MVEEAAKEAVSQVIAQGGVFAALYLLASLAGLYFFFIVYRSMREELKEARKQITDLQNAWREDTKTSLGSVTNALDTIERTINVITAIGRK